MKVSAKIMYLVLLLLSTFLLVGCFGPKEVELAKPTNVAIANGVVSWTAVQDADSYTVLVNTDRHDVTTTSFDLKTLTLAVGSYEIRIIAVKGDKVSEPSNAVTFTVEVTSLAQPTNVVITNGVVTWNEVQHAESYLVFVGATSHASTTRSFNLLNLSLPVGTHSITVKAVKGTIESPASTAVNFVVSPQEPTELAAPTNLVITAGVLTWNEVANATSYAVLVNGNTYPVTVRSFNLEALELPAGSHNVTVRAVRATLQSPASTAVVFVVEDVDQTDILQALLFMIDEDYEVDMVEDDFEWEYDFENYLDMVLLLTTYINTASTIGMSGTQVVEMFEHIMGMVERMNDGPSAVMLKEEIDGMKSFGLTTETATFVIMEMAMVSMDVGIGENERRLERRIAEIEDFYDQLDEMKLDSEFIAIYTKLELYVDSYYEEYLEEFFSVFTGWDYSRELNAFQSMAQEVIYEYSNPWYWDYPTVYTYMFFSIITNAKAAEDTEFLESVANNWEYVNVLYNIQYKLMDLQWMMEDIERIGPQSEMLIQMKDTLLANKAVVEETMEMVFGYLSDMYGAMPLALFVDLDTMVSGGFITIEEYLLLKDEIITILLANIPVKEDIAQVYTTLMIALSSFANIDLSDVEEFAPLFGEVTNLTLQLFLGYVGYVDVDMIETVMGLVPVEGLEGPDSVINVIELVVFIQQNIEAYLDTQLALVEQLQAVDTEAFVEFAVGFVVETLKAQLALEMSEEEFEIIEAIIDEVVANLSVYVEGIEVFATIGMDLLREFFESEGFLFVELVNLFGQGMGFESEEEVIAFALELEGLFVEFAKYNEAIFGNLTQEEILKVLLMARIPVKYLLAMEAGAEFEEAEDLFDGLVEPISIVIANLFIIEKAIIEGLVELGVVTEVTELEGLDLPILLMIGIVLLVDGVVDIDMEDFILETIAIVKEEILMNPFVLGLLDAQEEDVEGMVEFVVDMIQGMLAQVRDVAEFDFENMTEEEFEQLLEIFAFLMGGNDDEYHEEW